MNGTNRKYNGHDSDARLSDNGVPFNVSPSPDYNKRKYSSDKQVEFMAREEKINETLILPLDDESFSIADLAKRQIETEKETEI